MEEIQRAAEIHDQSSSTESGHQVSSSVVIVIRQILLFSNLISFN